MQAAVTQHHGTALGIAKAGQALIQYLPRQHLVAAQKKFFEEEGIKTPNFIVPGGGARVVQAVAAGQAMFALGDSNHPLKTTEKGRDAVILFATDQRCSYANVVVRKDLFDKGVKLAMGQAHVKRWIDDLMPLVCDDEDPLGVEDLCTHRLPLEEAPQVPARDFAYLGRDEAWVHRYPAEPLTPVHFRGVFDDEGRLMAVATHNTDIGDGFEREAYGEEYFETYSRVAYAMGVNIVVYALTH